MPLLVGLGVGVVALALVAYFALSPSGGESAGVGRPTTYAVAQGTAERTVTGVHWEQVPEGARVSLVVELTARRGRVPVGSTASCRAGSTNAVETGAYLPAYPLGAVLDEGQTVRGTMSFVLPQRQECQLQVVADGQVRAPESIPAADTGVAPLAAQTLTPRVAPGAPTTVTVGGSREAVTVHALQWARSPEGRDLLQVDAEVACQSGDACMAASSDFAALTTGGQGVGEPAGAREPAYDRATPLRPNERVRGWFAVEVPRGPGTLEFGSGRLGTGGEPPFFFAVPLPA